MTTKRSRSLTLRATYSLTPNASALLREVSAHDDRPMSAELRHLVRQRAAEIRSSDAGLSAEKRARFIQLLEESDD